MAVIAVNSFWFKFNEETGGYEPFSSFGFTETTESLQTGGSTSL